MRENDLNPRTRVNDPVRGFSGLAARPPGAYAIGTPRSIAAASSRVRTQASTGATM